MGLLRQSRPATGPLGRLVLALCLAGLCGGCAAGARTNRIIYGFNDVLDRVVLKPVTKGYETVVPPAFRQAISNVFDNLALPGVILNDFLQGKGRQGLADSGRFFVNTVFGIGGICDVATKAGLEKHEEDFGQTLGVWGVPQGPYFILPVFGPTTIRDVWSLPFRAFTTPMNYAQNGDLILGVRILDGIDQRSRASGAIAARDESAIDPYTFTREAYLQRREFLVRDGAVETEDYSDELEDLLEELDEE